MRHFTTRAALTYLHGSDACRHEIAGASVTMPGAGLPPEGRNMALKRSGDVRPAARHCEVNFWR